MSEHEKHTQVTEQISLDALLAQRTQQASELPWLQLKVEHQIEWRQQARQWLAQHPGGLTGSKPLPLRRRVLNAICSVAGAPGWHIVGVLLLCVVLSYVATLLLPATPSVSPAARPLSQWTLASIGAGLATIAIALANWPRLRQFYS